MIKDLLPIGSIVLLKDATKKMMVYGIKQSQVTDPDKEYDYIGVLYPEGNMGENFQFLFNHEDIQSVIFRGYEDIERQKFIKNLEAVYDNQE
ncbi:DUF4176 domain-containing protein [Anaerosporobacter sp.]